VKAVRALLSRLWANTSWGKIQQMEAEFGEMSQLTDAQLCEIYDRVLTDDGIHHDYKRRLCYIMATRLWVRWKQAGSVIQN